MAETLTYGYNRQDGVDVRVARIFNTYGKLIPPVLLTPPLTPLRRATKYVLSLVLGATRTRSRNLLNSCSESCRWTGRFELHYASA